VSDWLRFKLGGRMRVSTAILAIVFIGLFWVNQTFEPKPAAPEEPVPAVVPPGFVPDPNYTWVPRTNVRRPKEPAYTTTTPPTTTTTTTSPTTTTPTTTGTPSTTVTDPDGFGPLPPQTETVTPTTSAPPLTLPPFGPQTAPSTTAPPS
jgi:hypothetical protein